MDNAILNQHIRLHNLGAIHKHAAVPERDGELLALKRLHLRAVRNIAAVDNRAGDDVESENSGKLLDRQASRDIRDLGESLIARRKDGNLLEVLQGLDKIGLGS